MFIFWASKVEKISIYRWTEKSSNIFCMIRQTENDDDRNNEIQMVACGTEAKRLDFGCEQALPKIMKGFTFYE